MSRASGIGAFPSARVPVVKLAGLPQPDVLAQRLRYGLTAWWPEDETIAGAAAADPVGGFAMADTNTVGVGAGPSTKVPRARTFVNASAQVQSRAHTTALAVDGTDFTWVARFLATAVGANRGIAGSDNNAAGQREWFLRLNTTPRLTSVLQNSTTNLATATASAYGVPLINTWYQGTLTYNWIGRVLTIRMNVIPNVVASSGDVSVSTATHRIGEALSTSDPFGGSIAGVGMWRRGMDPIEDAYLWNSGAFRNFTPSRGFW